MSEETLIPKPILSTGLGDEQKGIREWELRLRTAHQKRLFFYVNIGLTWQSTNTMGTNPADFPEIVPAERQTLSDKGNLTKIREAVIRKFKKKKKTPHLYLDGLL